MRVQKNPSILFKGNIIDSHAHIGKWHSIDYSSIALNNVINDSFEITVDGKKQTDEVKGILVSNLSCLMGKNGKFIKDEIEGNKELLKICQDNPKIKASAVCQPGCGSANNIEKILNENTNNIYALKFHPQCSELAANDAAYEPYLKLAQKYKKPCVFHSDRIETHSSPAKIYQLAKKFSDVPVVLYHMSLASHIGDYKEVKTLSHLSEEDIKTNNLNNLDDVNTYIYKNKEKWNRDGIDTVKESIKNKDANLFLEISWAKPATVVQAIKEVGPDKVLFGSDAPLGEMGSRQDIGGQAGYIKNIQNIKQEIKNAVKDGTLQGNADEIIEKVFYKNANKLFFNNNFENINKQNCGAASSSLIKSNNKGWAAFTAIAGIGAVVGTIYAVRDKKIAKKQNATVSLPKSEIK